MSFRTICVRYADVTDCVRILVMVNAIFLLCLSVSLLFSLSVPLQFHIPPFLLPPPPSVADSVGVFVGSERAKQKKNEKTTRRKTEENRIIHKKKLAIPRFRYFQFINDCATKWFARNNNEAKRQKRRPIWLQWQAVQWKRTRFEPFMYISFASFNR